MDAVAPRPSADPELSVAEPARAAQAPGPPGRARSTTAPTGHAGPLRRRRPTTPSRRRRSGARAWSRASRWPTTPPTSTSAPRSWASGASSPAAAATAPSYEELVETEGRPRLRMLAGPASRPRACSRRPSSTATSRASARATTWWCCHARRVRTRGRSGAVHLPAPAPRPAPVPRRLLPAARVGGEVDVVAVPAGHRWAPRSPRRRPSCSRTTPTATTSSCTACRCSSPRRWPSTGTPGSARSWASAATTPRPGRRSCARATAARATPSATPPAPTSRTAPSSSSCCDPERIGVELSEELQLHPEQSTDAHHRAPPRGEVLQRD